MLLRVREGLEAGAGIVSLRWIGSLFSTAYCVASAAIGTIER